MVDRDLAEGDDAQILQAALSTAFSSGHVRKEPASAPQSLTSKSKGQAPSPPGSGPEGADSAFQAHDDAWKAEYEANLQSWRAQAAQAREKAEKERERWESIRAAERGVSTRPKLDEAQSRADQDAGWETIAKAGSSGQISGSASRDPVDAKVSAATGAEASKSQPASRQHSRETTGEDAKLSLSQKWETLPTSPTSSYPSLSFPDNSNTSSHKARRPVNQDPPQSATLTVFDSSLPTRVRVSALLSSLAINLLLPFVNGVMLGFGEIFAKAVVIGWFGWKLPGSVVTSVGIRSSKTQSN